MRREDRGEAGKKQPAMMLRTNQAKDEERGRERPQRRNTSTFLLPLTTPQHPRRRVNEIVAGEPSLLFQSFPLTLAQAIPMENHSVAFLHLFYLASF